jgi:N-methylhydantoinase A
MRSYGHAPERAEAQVVNARLVVRVGADRSSHRAFQPVSGRAAESSRKAYFGERWGAVETPVIPREALKRSPASGPLFIDEFDSTTVIPPDCSARLDDYGNIAITVGETSAK